MATMADVLACYRLLLGRAPDAGGLEHYHRRVEGGDLPVADLVAEFIGSVEFAHAHAHDGAPGRGPSEVVATVEGFRLYVDPSDFAVGHTVARTATYEPDVSAIVRGALHPGQTFVDVGANIGWFSMLGASLVGPAGRVVAIEPNPRNVALMRHSAKENHFDNIEILAVALAGSAGAVALETDGSNGRVIPINGPPAQPVEASFVVAAYPLDALLGQCGVTQVDVMKIDVEGAEPLVLQGGAGTIARERPVIISEFYPLALESFGGAGAYLATLRRLGYRLRVIGVEGDPDVGDQDDVAIMSMAHDQDRDHVDLLALPA